MARKPKDEAPDLAEAHDLTAGLIERLACPPGKGQAFLRDKKSPGLRVRVTANGAKSFVFEAKLDRETIRRTIGDARSWSIDQAREEANKLRVQLDSGEDPREADARKAQEKAERQAAAVARALPVGEAWAIYLVEGSPKRKEAFKPRYLADLQRMSAAGGERKKRGPGITRPGPLYPLLSQPLASIDEDALQTWFETEAKASKHQAARALMMFRGFLRWASTRPAYRALVKPDAAKARGILDRLPAQQKRTDALEAAQVAGWWSGVSELPNPTASAYLRALLLTGARREELAALKWAAVDFRWNKLTIADKVGTTRTIPLSPYLRQLITALPRRSAFVFASAGKSGRIADARSSHKKALESAGIEHLTVHGLRRSFALLGEAAGAPAGAIAQIMGHRPSATHEGYKPRSVDALRPFMALIEAHILKQAGVEFVASLPPGLHVASAA